MRALGGRGKARGLCRDQTILGRENKFLLSKELTLLSQVLFTINLLLLFLIGQTQLQESRLMSTMQFRLLGNEQTREGRWADWGANRKSVTASPSTHSK